jgi:hypothetical protein
MEYNIVRPNIKSGDILAWSHKGWGSWRDFKIQMVRFFTQSEYSHVGIAWVVGGRVFVLEAVQPLVRIYPLSRTGDFYWIPMQLNWSEEVEEEALANVGDKYSQWEAIVAFFTVPGINNKWECAEYVAHIVTKAGVDLGDKLTPTCIVENALKLVSKLYYVTSGIK